MTEPVKYEAVAIGASAGGLQAISALLGHLPATYDLPVIIVQHRAKDSGDTLESMLQFKSALPVCQAEEKTRITGGRVYVAPPDYHLMVEEDRSFSLSFDPPVWYSRPSIDVFFESAAGVYRERLVAILLTGANADGAWGMGQVKEHGGLTIAQQPEGALAPAMPQAAIDADYVQHIWSVDQIGFFLENLKAI